MTEISSSIEGVCRDLVIEEGFAPLEAVLHGAAAAAGLFNGCVARLDRDRLNVHAFLEWRGQDGLELSARAESLRRALEGAAEGMSQRVAVTLFLVARAARDLDGMDSAMAGLREGHFLEKILVGRAGVSLDGVEIRHQGRLAPLPSLEWFEGRFSAGSGHSPADAEAHLRSLEADEARSRRLLSKGGTPATWALIGLNVAAFALQHFAAHQLRQGAQLDQAASMNLALQVLGANQRDWVFGMGQWWRLFSSMFLHGNELHLMFNMAALFSLGSLLERLCGPPRFLLIYFAAGLMGSLMSVLNPQGAISVGASGAILGLAGALLAPHFRRPREFPRSLARRIFESLLRPLGVTFALGLLLSLIGSPVRFDNWAHFGGVFSGFGLALAFPSLLQKPQQRRP